MTTRAIPRIDRRPVWQEFGRGLHPIVMLGEIQPFKAGYSLNPIVAQKLLEIF